MILRLSELKIASDKILDHIQKQHGDLIEIEGDYYWDVDDESRLDPYKEPDQMELGQLSDDWSTIKQIVNGEKEPIGYALVWLAALYKTIGNKYIP